MTFLQLFQKRNGVGVHRFFARSPNPLNGSAEFLFQFGGSEVEPEFRRQMFQPHVTGLTRVHPLRVMPSAPSHRPPRQIIRLKHLVAGHGITNYPKRFVQKVNVPQIGANERAADVEENRFDPSES